MAGPGLYRGSYFRSCALARRYTHSASKMKLVSMLLISAATGVEAGYSEKKCQKFKRCRKFKKQWEKWEEDCSPSPPPPSPSSPLLPSAYPGGPNAWYCSGAFDIASSTWRDCSGNGKTATLSGSGLVEVRSAGHGATSAVLALSGTTSSVISFGAVIQSLFMVCSVTR